MFKSTDVIETRFGYGMFRQSDAGIKYNIKYFNVTWQWDSDSDARNVYRNLIR